MAGVKSSKSGGKAVLDKYGPEFFRQIGSKGGKAIRDRGVDMADLGRRGGTATKANHGPEFYVEMGRKGGKAGIGGHRPTAGRRKRADAEPSTQPERE